MIIILTKRSSERLLYACEHIFKNVLGLPYSIVTEMVNTQPNNIVLAYGLNEPSATVSIFQSSFILQDSYPDTQNYQKIIENDWPYFKVLPGEYDFVTDVFSLCFFSISRYEEYVIADKDNFGRFPSVKSVFFRDNVIKSPHVDTAIFDLVKVIQSKINGFNPKPKLEGLKLSFDIDHSWKYANKGFFRNAGGALKDLYKLNFRDLLSRIKILAGIKNDPYFNFEEIYILEKWVPIHFFILLGNYNKLDINIDPKNKSFRKLVQTISTNFPTGVHPSTKASKDKNILQTEIERLAKITGKKTKDSRQHFLMLNLPETYQKLEECGIENDFTMGYADAMGFRAGTAHSFNWFDFTKNKPSSLRIHPFFAMDVAMRHYQKIDAKTAFLELNTIYEQIRITGGSLEIIWHNSSFIDSEGWGKWKDELQSFIQKNSILRII